MTSKHLLSIISAIGVPPLDIHAGLISSHRQVCPQHHVTFPPAFTRATPHVCRIPRITKYIHVYCCREIFYDSDIGIHFKVLLTLHILMLKNFSRPSLLNYSRAISPRPCISTYPALISITRPTRYRTMAEMTHVFTKDACPRETPSLEVG